MGNAFFKYLSRAKPDPELLQENSSRAQNRAAVKVSEQTRSGLYHGEKRAIVNEENLVVMSDVIRGQPYVRVVEEGQNIYTLVPDNDLPRRGVIKINAESHELTFSDNPFDKNEGVMFETSPCQNGDCLELTLIDSDVHGKLHVRSEDNALVVKERKSSGFRIIP